MAGPWLYPISAGANRTFTLQDSGTSIPVTVASYTELVENGRIIHVRYWFISQHWRHIKIGDEVFIYTGDDDLGIIGYAKVDGVKQRGSRWCFVPKFDLEKCQCLIAHPIPADVVRKWVFPRRGVTNLAPVEARLRASLRW